MEHDEKLLLLGPGGAGKTCMRSIIFDNYFPRDALRLGITISMDQSRVHILRNLFLNLYDCGGQHQYVVEYLNKQREYIFRKVAVMLFVFDINSMSVDEPLKEGAEDGPMLPSNSWTKRDMLDYFKQAMCNIHKYSPQAKVFVLLHKIDLIGKDSREQVAQNRKCDILNVMEELQLNGLYTPEQGEIQFFCTSIWGNSLYRAYSSVVCSLIPHRERLLQAIKELGEACRAVEVALYERSTFLCLGHVTRQVTKGSNGGACGPGSSEPITCTPGMGELRSAQVSETVKHFKLSCMNNTTSLDGFTIETEEFTAILTHFTDYVQVLLVCDDPNVSAELHHINIQAARNRFATFLFSKDDPHAEEMRNVL
eukprot:gene4211-3043_t